MKNECWINVYDYPKLKGYVYSHCCKLLTNCIKLEKNYPPEHRKVVYRIHVRMK